jgi:hypothetical protein
MKTKQIFFTLAFIMSVLLTQAQDRYEYMTIEFNQSLVKEIQISIDGNQYFEEKADYSPAKHAFHNLTPFFKKVHEYEDKGWELMYFNTLGDSRGGQNFSPLPIAYLKKKRI